MFREFVFFLNMASFHLMVFQMTTDTSLTFTDLPILVQEKIIQSLPYTELSRLRSVSKYFHQLCSEQLNRGYFQLETIIHDLQKQIKTKLPRRESERHKVSKIFIVVRV